MLNIERASYDNAASKLFSIFFFHFGFYDSKHILCRTSTMVTLTTTAIVTFETGEKEVSVAIRTSLPLFRST